MKRLMALLSLLTVLVLLLGMLPASAASATQQVQHTHNWTKWKEQERTYRSCTDHKVMIRTCTICGMVQDKDGGEVGHDVKTWNTTKKPTCTETGKRQGVCQRCGKTVTVTLKAAGHKFGEWTTVQLPTRNGPGKRERVCSVCGYKETDEYNYPTLSRGGRNNRASDVKELQSKLNKAGYPCGKADGKYGKKTENAVKDVERDHGLEIDGIADILVWITLDEILSGKDGLRLSASLKNAQESYGEGDTVSVDWTVYNDSKDDMSWPEVFVSMNGEGTGIANGNDGTEATFPAGSSYSGTYEWKLEGDDVAGDTFTLGFIAAATPRGKSEIYSNSVDIAVAIDSSFSNWTPPSPVEPAKALSIVVEKYTDTEPANGSFFTEGEVITYTIYVENTGPDLTGGMIYDPLMTPPTEPLIPLISGQNMALVYTYTVTEEDVQNPYLENMATIIATDGNEEVTAVTPIVYVDLGVEEESLLVTKEVTSTAENDPYYVENETVTYLITIENTGDTEITEIEVYDPLKGSNEDAMVDIILSLPPHSKTTCEYNYTVTADDVVTTYIENTAFARYWGGEGDEHTVDSNTVTVYTADLFELFESDTVSVVKKVVNHPKYGDKYTEGETVEYEITVTNKLPHTLYNVEMYDSLIPSPSYLTNLGDIPPEGSASAKFSYKITKADVETGDGSVINYAWIVCIAGREWEIYGSNRVIVHTGKYAAPRADVCVRTLKAGGLGLAEYELDFCKDHEKTAKNAADLLSKGHTGDAYAAWKSDIEELYARWKKQDPANASVIEADRKAFFADFDALRALLETLSPDTAADTLFDMLSNKCADLCYALGRAPEARRDTYRSTGYAPGSGACSAQYVPDNGSDRYCAETACGDHLAIAKSVDDLLKSASTSSERDLSFRRAQRLWLNGVNSLYEDLYRAGYDVTQERMLFGDMLDAREAALTLLYPSSPETVSDLIASSLKVRALTLCNATSGSKGGSQAKADATYAGTWYAVLEGQPVTLQINANGTCTLDFAGASVDAVWEKTTAGMVLNKGLDDESTLAWDGEFLKDPSGMLTFGREKPEIPEIEETPPVAATGAAQFEGTWRLANVYAYGLTFDAATAADKLGMLVDLTNDTLVIDGLRVDPFGRGAKEFEFTEGKLLLKGPADDGGLDETVELTADGVRYVQYGIEYYFTK